MNMRRLVVFSDYDGTIADEKTGTCDAATQCVRMLKEAGIPLVIVSSKTFEELREISRFLDLNESFAFENGGGIAYPLEIGYRIEEMGLSVQELRKLVPFIESVIDEKIETLECMDIPRLCAYTGLSPEEAVLAKERRFSLPFIVEHGHLTNEKFEALSADLQKKGVLLRWGGRFYHLITRGAGKSNAVQKVCEFYAAAENVEIVAAGIGNSENDFDMLNVVHHPYLVRNRSSHIDYSVAPYPVTKRCGFEGFCEAIEQILARYA